MTRDKRGRVRFAYNGYRYELTKSGLNAFERTVNEETSQTYAQPGELTAELLATEEGRTKLAEAIAALHAREFTTAIHIPESMRAV